MNELKILFTQIAFDLLEFPCIFLGLLDTQSDGNSWTEDYQVFVSVR